MRRGYVPLLLVLALIWGSSFMFIEIAIDDLSPAATMTGRLLFASVALGTVLVAKRGFRQAVRSVRDFGWAGVVLGVISTALPFWLIAWGQTRIDSGIAAIANASMPIFVALLAVRFARHERVTGSGLRNTSPGDVGKSREMRRCTCRRVRTLRCAGWARCRPPRSPWQ